MWNEQPRAVPPPSDDDSDFDVRDAYAAQEAAARMSGWDDPALDEYDDYDAHRDARGGASSRVAFDSAR